MAQADGTPAKVAGIVLLQADGSALLQLRDEKPGLSASGLWVFPGGHCQSDEGSDVCARREFFEETGYQCAEMHYLTEFFYRSPDTQKDFHLTFFWSRYDGQQPVHCYEGQAVRFVPRAELDPAKTPDYLPGVWDLALQASGAR